MKKLLLIPILVLFFTVSTTNAYFSDTTNVFGEEYIDWFQEQGVVEGYADGTFRPYNNINRAEFLKMLYETTGSVNSSTFPVNNPFNDVQYDQYYYKYVMQAYADGIVQGYGDGTFRPANNITLAEAMKIVQEAFLNEIIMDTCEEKYVSFYSSCGQAVPDTDLLLGCKQITKKDWSFKYFCTDTKYNIHGESLWVQFDKPISRATMAQLLFRAKAIRDNDLSPFTEDLVPKDIIFTYTDPNNNFTLNFPISWEKMITELQEYPGDTKDDNYYGTGFGFLEQENIIQIVEYTAEQWIELLAQDGLIPEYLGAKDGMVYTFYQASDCVNKKMCLLMESIEKIKKSFKLQKNITLEAR